QADARVAVLTLVRRLDLAAEQMAEELHAVADAEHRHAELEDLRIDRGRPFLEHARRTAGEDDGGRREGLDGLGIHRARMDLAIDTQLADSPGDELGVLAAEVEDENG